MKQIGYLTLLIVAMLILAIAFPVAASGPKAAATPTVAAAPAPAASPMPPHPRIHDALEEMHHAKEHLEHAEGEFHGHRAKAIEHLDAAIHEAEICEREP